MKAFSINIVGLALKIHHFDFNLNDAFFEKYGKEILQGGNFEVKVALDKHETFIAADFDIAGYARLVCDRSLEPFDHPIEMHKKMVFKYGDEAKEVSDEIIIIDRDQISLELGQLMYEFIGVEIPMKKLHPRFKDEENEGDLTEGKIVYTSSTNEEKAIDPRWEVLKKLK